MLAVPVQDERAATVWLVRIHVGIAAIEGNF
jgi:hypothetical protein